MKALPNILEESRIKKIEFYNLRTFCSRFLDKIHGNAAMFSQNLICSKELSQTAGKKFIILNLNLICPGAMSS